MSKKRYITIQILPDDSSQAWTIKLRYRFFEFLFYAIIIALFAVALAAVKITEINGKVLTADHLALINTKLLEKQEKMVLLEKELEKVSEQEKKIREIVQTFITQPQQDSSLAERVVSTAGTTQNTFSPGELDQYMAQIRAAEKRSLPGPGYSKGSHIPDIWPVAGIISQPFSIGTNTVGRHEGIDIVAESNALVVSAGRGIVVFSGWDKDLGKAVRIDHDYNTQTLYGHLSRIVVQVGDRVEKGSALGAVGSTGNSLGPHLHYEVLVNGKSVDPQTYLK